MDHPVYWENHKSLYFSSSLINYRFFSYKYIFQGFLTYGNENGFLNVYYSFCTWMLEDLMCILSRWWEPHNLQEFWGPRATEGWVLQRVKAYKNSGNSESWIGIMPKKSREMLGFAKTWSPTTTKVNTALSVLSTKI